VNRTFEAVSVVGQHVQVRLTQPIGGLLKQPDNQNYLKPGRQSHHKRKKLGAATLVLTSLSSAAFAQVFRQSVAGRLLLHQQAALSVLSRSNLMPVCKTVIRAR
jgi:hypothetical protein